eukprot:1142514-Pelagomonas_calceolata.AAC.1
MPLKSPCMPLHAPEKHNKHQLRGSMQVEHQLGGKLRKVLQRSCEGKAGQVRGIVIHSYFEPSQKGAEWLHVCTVSQKFALRQGLVAARAEAAQKLAASKEQQQEQGQIINPVRSMSMPLIALTLRVCLYAQPSAYLSSYALTLATPVLLAAAVTAVHDPSPAVAVYGMHMLHHLATEGYMSVPASYQACHDPLQQLLALLSDPLSELLFGICSRLVVGCDASAWHVAAPTAVALVLAIEASAELPVARTCGSPNSCRTGAGGDQVTVCGSHPCMACGVWHLAAPTAWFVAATPVWHVVCGTWQPPLCGVWRPPVCDTRHSLPQLLHWCWQWRYGMSGPYWVALHMTAPTAVALVLAIEALVKCLNASLKDICVRGAVHQMCA